MGDDAKWKEAEAAPLVNRHNFHGASSAADGTVARARGEPTRARSCSA